MLTQIFLDRKIFWIVLVVGLVLDIGSKIWADGAIKPAGWQVGDPSPTFPVIEGVFAWKWAANIGAAFSIFAGKRWMLAVIGVLALVGVVYYVYKTPKTDRTLLFGLGLVGSGAVGNVHDRIAFGWVRDFMYFDFDLPLYDAVSFIPQRYPVFNVADIAILGGVILLVTTLTIQERRLKREEREAKAREATAQAARVEKKNQAPKAKAKAS